MRKFHKTGIITVLLASALVATSAVATPLSLDQGSKVLLVDGNADDNVSINLATIDVWDGYYLQYSLNGGDWLDVSDYRAGDVFTGGDILDFALAGTNNPYYGTTSDEFYVLSNDAKDYSFSATMVFSLELDPFHAQQPTMNTPYYKNLSIAWAIDQTGTTFSNSFAIINQEQSWNDGVAPAPVPEPATMLLLGTGLMGLAGISRKRKSRTSIPPSSKGRTAEL